MNNITCYFDGGYDNAKKENGYGSFRIEYESWEGYPIVITSTQPYPNVESNNEAEYEAITRLMYFLDGLICSTHYDSEGTEVMVYGDSALVINQTIGKWKVSASNLVRYRKEASDQLKLLRNNTDVTLQWVEREEIVKKLGH